MLFPWGTAFFSANRHDMSKVGALHENPKQVPHSTTASDLEDLLRALRAENIDNTPRLESFIKHLCALIEVIIGFREVTRNLHKTSRWYRDFVCKLDGATDLLKGLGFEDAGDKLIPPSETQYYIRQFSKMEQMASYFDSTSSSQSQPDIQPATSLSNSVPQAFSPLHNAVGRSRSLRLTPRIVSSLLENDGRAARNSPQNASSQFLSQENKQLARRLRDLESQIHDYVIANEELEEENSKKRVAEHELENVKLKFDKLDAELTTATHQNTVLVAENEKLQSLVTRERQWYMMGFMNAAPNRGPITPRNCVYGCEPDELCSCSVIYPHSFDNGTLVEGDEDELEDELHGHSAGSLERLKMREREVKRGDDDGNPVFGGLHKELLNGWRKMRKRNRDLEQETVEYRERVQQLERQIAKLRKSRQRQAKVSRANSSLRKKHPSTRHEGEPFAMDAMNIHTQTQTQLQSEDDLKQPIHLPAHPDIAPQRYRSPDARRDTFHPPMNVLPRRRPPPQRVSQLTVSIRRRQDADGTRKRLDLSDGSDRERETSTRSTVKRKGKKSKNRTRQQGSGDGTGDEFDEPTHTKHGSRGNVPPDLIKLKTKSHKHKTKSKQKAKMKGKNNNKAVVVAHGNKPARGADAIYVQEAFPKKPTSDLDPFSERQTAQSDIETHGRLISKLLRKDELLHHERTKNRELRHTVTEVQRQSSASSDTRVNVLHANAPCRLGTDGIRFRRNSQQSQSSSCTNDDVALKRDTILKVFGDEGLDQLHLRVCVANDDRSDDDEVSMRGLDGYLVGDGHCVGIDLLSRHCETGGVAVLCVCVEANDSRASNFDLVSSVNSSMKLKRVVEELCSAVAVGLNTVEIGCFDSVVRNERDLNSFEFESVLDRVRKDECMDVHKKVIVLSCFNDTGAAAHVVFTNVIPSQLMFSADGRRVIEKIDELLPCRNGLASVSGTGGMKDVLVGVVAHLDHDQSDFQGYGDGNDHF